MSFDIFAYKELKGTVSDCEDRFHQIERQLEKADPESERRVNEKQSPQFIGLVEGFLVELEDRLMEISRYRIQRLSKNGAGDYSTFLL